MSFVGWKAGLTDGDRRGDELWIKLSVTPSLESEAGAIGALSNDRYIETYVVRDRHFHYQGGRPARIVRREVRPNPESGDFFVFD